MNNSISPFSRTTIAASLERRSMRVGRFSPNIPNSCLRFPPDGTISNSCKAAAPLGSLTPAGLHLSTRRVCSDNRDQFIMATLGIEALSSVKGLIHINHAHEPTDTRIESRSIDANSQDLQSRYRSVRSFRTIAW